MDPQKQQFEWQKQSVVYNGYGPTETTLGTVFSSEVLPPRIFYTGRMFNCYGPCEATIMATKLFTNY